MGFAQRHIHVQFEQNSTKRKAAKSLIENAKTLGDWIRARRFEKNLMPCQLAAKMGIASALIQSWETDLQHPDIKQLAALSSVLEFDFEDVEPLIVKLKNLPD